MQRAGVPFIGSLTPGFMPQAAVSWWQYVATLAGASNAFQWREVTDTSEEAVFQYPNNSNRYLASFEVGIAGRNVRIECGTSYAPIFQWAHIIASYNINTLTIDMAVNGRLCNSNELNAETIESLAIPQSAWENPRAYFLQTGGAAYGVWFAHEFLDLTDSSVIAKFINSNFEPVQLGPDGSNPTGNQPLLYLDDPASNVLNNRGFGGNFDTISGTLIDSNHGPTSPARFSHDNQSTAGLNSLFTNLSVGATQQLTLSMWFFPVDATGTFITAHDGVTFFMELGLDGSDQLTYTFRNTAGTTILEGTSASGSGLTAAWHHILFSVNMQATTGGDAVRIAIDGVDRTQVPTTFVSGGTIAFDATSATLYNGNDGTTDMDFFWSQWWMDFGTFIDANDSDVIELYYDIGPGAPVNLGSNGETPTGTSPEVYQDFPTSLGLLPVTFPMLTNRGTGGDFTQTNVHIPATTNPAAEFLA